MVVIGEESLTRHQVVLGDEVAEVEVTMDETGISTALIDPSLHPEEVNPLLHEVEVDGGIEVGVEGVIDGRVRVHALHREEGTPAMINSHITMHLNLSNLLGPLAPRCQSVLLNLCSILPSARRSLHPQR